MTFGRIFLLCGLLFLSPVNSVISASASPFSATINQQNGLPEISIGGAKILQSYYGFWRKNWAWAGPSTKLQPTAPFRYRLEGISRDLDLAFIADTGRTSNNTLTWDFDFDVKTTSPDVIGGGIRFILDLATFQRQLGEPRLLDDNRGWSWGREGSTKIEFRFDSPVATVYFERGQKNEIRVFFYNGEVPQGQQHHHATLILSNDISVVPAIEERFGNEDYQSWRTNYLDWPIAPWSISPVDLSFLNAAEKPAGKHGFLRTQHDSLVFDDGTFVRFWGTTLSASALFGMIRRDDVRLQAHRLSQLGFNLIRLTHHDSPWVNPNIFGDSKLSNSSNLDDAMLQRLDWWIKCLKDEGIYVWLDLHVQRYLKETDGIQDFDEIGNGRPTGDLKGFNYINPSVQDAMRRFSDAYLTHTNVYTGLAYKDDPGIAAILITNENDVTSHFGNKFLPDKNVPLHASIYMAEAKKFAALHRLDPNRTWRAWEPGPSKLFLNELERRFDVTQIADLRRSGVKVPIVTTSTWGNSPLSSLPSLTTGDLIDVHSYGSVGELEKDPAYAPTLVDWMAMGQIVDRPLSVSEWNVEPFPVPDRHSIPLYVAGSASLQGWDALIQYAYSQQPLTNPGSPSNWHAFNDPALIATLPAAALLYRRGDVREAATSYVFTPTPAQLFDQHISPSNSPALRAAAELGKLMIAMPATPSLPWLEASQIPRDAKTITDPKASLLPIGATEVVSDTGELRRNWDDGIYTISTPRTQAATGFIGGRRIALPDVEADVITRNASIVVQSLDDAPIHGARNILISLGARSVPSPGNKLPFHSEPVIGKLAIRAPAGLKLYRQHGLAAENIELPASYENGRYRIELMPEIASYWMALK